MLVKNSNFNKLRRTLWKEKKMWGRGLLDVDAEGERGANTDRESFYGDMQ